MSVLAIRQRQYTLWRTIVALRINGLTWIGVDGCVWAAAQTYNVLPQGLPPPPEFPKKVHPTIVGSERNEVRALTQISVRLSEPCNFIIARAGYAQSNFCRSREG